MKLRYRIALGLGAIAAILIAGAAVLLETQAGLHWAIALAEKHSHGALEIGAAHGKLAGPLTLDNLRLTLPDAVIEVRHLELDWRPSALAAGKLRITSIRGSGVRITTHPDNAPSQGLPQHLELPLHVIVTAARFDDLALKTSAGELRLDRLAFALDASDELLRLTGLEARGPRIAVAGELQAQPHDDWSVRARLAAIVRPPDYPLIEGRTRLTGALRGKLALEQTLRTPLRAELKATVTNLFDLPHARGTLHVARLDPHAIEPDWLELQIGTDLNFDGSLHRFNAHGVIALANTATHTVNLDLEAGLSDRRLQIAHLNLALVNAPARLSLSGGVNTDAPHAADLSLAWRNLAWPLDETKPTLASAAGGAHLRGKPGGWTLDAAALLRTGDLPQGRWSLKADGNSEEITLAALIGRWLGGRIAGKGEIGLAGEHPFQFTARVRGLQANAVSKKLNGQAGFDLAANGKLEPSVQAQVRVSKLSGNLQGLPVKGKIALAYANEAITVQTLTLAAGPNRLDAEGRWGRNANLDWQLQAPELAALGAGLGGRLEARGSVTGASDAPHIKARLSAEKLHWHELGIERAKAQADIDLGARTASALELHVRNLSRGRLEVHQLDATLDGPPDAQHFSFSLAGNEGDIKLAGSGVFAHGQWRGELDKGRLRPTRGPDFDLAAPAALVLGSQTLQLGTNCWRSTHNAEFCVGAASNPQGWKANLVLHALPLALADPYLEDDLALAGELNGHLVAAGGGGKLNVLAALHVGNGSVTRNIAGTPQRFAFDEAGLEARLDNSTAHARLGLLLADGGMLDATADIPWRRHAEPAGKLHLIAHLPDLSGLGALSEAISDVGGRLDADLDVSGSLDAPRFAGEVHLGHAAMTLTQPGTRIEHGDIVLRGTGAGLRIKGKLADAHNGSLRVQGTLEREADQWALDAHIKGKDFHALNMPEAKVAVSPDLELTVRDRAIAVNGSVVIPSAQIEPPHFSNAIAPTPDLVIVGGKKAQNKPPWLIGARLHIRLGPDVHFNGYGLDARIGGELTLHETPGKLTTASGELKIRDGHYKAYGQNLDIEHGRLLFSGGPIANPGLDIRAVRRIGMVTAGLQVTGTLRNPQLQVFSDPPMSQSNALAYLLFGHGVQQNSGSENSTMNQAANAIGIAGGTYFVKSIGKHVGVDTVSVENASSYSNNPNQASLFLGKYLSPRLYVSYGIGIYEPINLLRVRYTLSRHWALEAESGTISGADILYNIEH